MRTDRMAAVRAAMIARKAAAAGLSVAEFMRRGELEAPRVRGVGALIADRTLQHLAIGRRAAAHQRTFTILTTTEPRKPS